MTTQASQSETHPNPQLWWKNRRRMAYAAIVWAFLQTMMWIGVAILFPGAMSLLTPVIAWSYGLSGVIIVGYFGNTAVEEYIKHKRMGS